MCMAIPGKIVKYNGGKVTVDYGSQSVEASVIDGNYKLGDYVIVQGRLVIEKIPKAQVKKWQDFIKNDYDR